MKAKLPSAINGLILTAIVRLFIAVELTDSFGLVREPPQESCTDAPNCL